MNDLVVKENLERATTFSAFFEKTRDIGLGSFAFTAVLASCGDPMMGIAAAVCLEFCLLSDIMRQTYDNISTACRKRLRRGSGSSE